MSTEVSEMAIVTGTGNRTISTIHWGRTTFRAADSKLHQLERELSGLGPTTDLTTTTPILPHHRPALHFAVACVGACLSSPVT